MTLRLFFDVHQCPCTNNTFHGNDDGQTFESELFQLFHMWRFLPLNVVMQLHSIFHGPPAVYWWVPPIVQHSLQHQLIEHLTWSWIVVNCTCMFFTTRAVHIYRRLIVSFWTWSISLTRAKFSPINISTHLRSILKHIWC